MPKMFSLVKSIQDIYWKSCKEYLARKDIKGIHIENKQVKLSLFVADMFLDVETHKKFHRIFLN
jgi:hypothetical protein